jgi:hypothetical protein
MLLHPKENQRDTGNYYTLCLHHRRHKAASNLIIKIKCTDTAIAIIKRNDLFFLFFFQFKRNKKEKSKIRKRKGKRKKIVDKNYIFSSSNLSLYDHHGNAISWNKSNFRGITT